MARLIATLSMAGALALAACQVSGTAPPMSADARHGDVGLGSPGSGAP